MALPFTAEQFLDVFRRYNEAVWPAQWLLAGLAALGILAAARGTPRGSRVACAVLAALWAWTGLAYHVAFFRAVNPVAVVFGALFVVQGALFGWLAVARGRLTFRPRPDVAGIAGATLLL